MKSVQRGLTLAIMVSLAAWAQGSATPASGAHEQQGSTDQAATSAEPKGHTTLIGCLSGPDASGKYTLRSMEHRTGVEIVGSDDLKKDSGDKVKLTGLWEPGDKPAQKGKEPRKFQASEVEVMSGTCQTPSEKAPVSKQKQEKQQQKQTSITPAGTDTTTPK